MKILTIAVVLCSLLVWRANVWQSEQVKPKADTVKVVVHDTVLEKATRAIAQIESHGNPRARRFEPSVFKRLTGSYAATFNEAKKINWRAAMKSTSVGMFQILGTNYPKAGYKDVVEMYHADSLRQVKAFHHFIRHENIEHLLREKKYRSFARCYNGKGYKRNNYDVKLTALMQ